MLPPTKKRANPSHSNRSKCTQSLNTGRALERAVSRKPTQTLGISKTSIYLTRTFHWALKGMETLLQGKGLGIKMEALS